MPQVVDDGGSIPPTRSNPWVVGSNPSLAAKSSLKKIGEVGEWFIPEVLKTSVPVMGPSVRIRPSPLNIQISKNLLYLLRFCYVFVCFKDSHRNNKKLKQII